jgi:hypothetical protein
MLDTDRGANIITLHDRRHVYSLHSVFFLLLLSEHVPVDWGTDDVTTPGVFGQGLWIVHPGVGAFVLLLFLFRIPLLSCARVYRRRSELRDGPWAQERCWLP